MTLLEEGSLQVLLYMPQNASTLLATGAELNLIVDPYPEPLTATVVRLGDQYEPAPEHLKRDYREGQKLLTVHLQPRARRCAGWPCEWAGLSNLPIARFPSEQEPWMTELDQPINGTPILVAEGGIRSSEGVHNGEAPPGPNVARIPGGRSIKVYSWSLCCRTAVPTAIIFEWPRLGTSVPVGWVWSSQ